MWRTRRRLPSGALAGSSGCILVVEDARHRRQRPKVELFSDYVFVVPRRPPSTTAIAA
jgi:hypothetical protein